MSVSGGRVSSLAHSSHADWSDSLSLSLFLSLALLFGQCALALSTFLVRVIEGTAACLGRAPFYMRRQRERHNTGNIVNWQSARSVGSSGSVGGGVGRRCHILCGNRSSGAVRRQFVVPAVIYDPIHFC